MNPRTYLLLTSSLILAVSCADYEMAFGADKASDSGWYAEGDYDGANEDPTSADDSGYDDGYGSEDEGDFLKLSPAATHTFVFVANPDRNTVTRIHVETMDVQTTQVGVNPTIALTTSDYSKAVTFNKDSDDVSIIDANSLDVTSVDVRENFNQMLMSPDGVWVACFHDPAAERDDTGSTGGTQSYNELSLVNIDTYQHVPLVVGSNPHGVKFTADSELAIVVSDDYLSIIDLTVNEPFAEHVQISDDLVDPPEAEEVVLDPAGSYAIVRQYAATTLRAVDLVNFEVVDLDVGDNPTDLDVTPDGTHAVAVARGSGELWLYDLLDIEAAPTIIDIPVGEVFGSVVLSPDNSKGLLYSTQTGLSRYATWDRNDDSITVRSLVKPVSSVGLSPTGGTALIFHSDGNGEDVDSDSAFYNSFALSLIDLDDFFSNPLKLPAEPIAYDNTEDGENGIFIMEDQPYLVELDYETLLYEEVELRSVPVYIGVLPETRLAYASQEHSLGRISFYDIDAQELQTITGFELNSGIEEY